MADSDTVLMLRAALDRLLNGKPERTKPDGRINISRINTEAGLSQGAIYYYKEFVEEAKDIIKKHKTKKFEQSKHDALPDFQRAPKNLKDELKKEMQLKIKYRTQRNDFKSITDEMIKINVSLAFRILELEDENRRLTKGRIFDLR